MRRLTPWIAVLFAIGSACFFVGPFPGFVELVGSAVDATVFFVGSIFFTSAALLQYLQAADAAGGRVLPSAWRDADWWSAAVQFVGTLAFNVTTFQALQTGLDANEYDRLVWAPDAVGSVCFLVASAVAYVHVARPRRTIVWWIAAINLAGSVAFGISAVASYVVPSTGSAVDLAAANAWTAVGGLCFLVGAVLLFRTRDPKNAEGRGSWVSPPADSSRSGAATSATRDGRA